jgi:hypothetical protein
LRFHDQAGLADRNTAGLERLLHGVKPQGKHM